MSFPNASDAWGIAALLGAIAVLTLAARGVQRFTSASAETVRKLLHVGGGLVALALPWLFETAAPVIILAAAACAGFALLRSIPALRAGAGQALLAVERRSAGEFWFIAGVATIFALAHDTVVVYAIGIVMLAVADTAAALIGVAYGRHPFAVPGGSKSVEGSAAFLLTAFLVVHVPLLLLTDTGRVETVLIAANVAILATLAEADATRGVDNFLIPVLTVVLLQAFAQTDRLLLTAHLGVLLGLCVVVFSYRRRATLSTDALIGAALIGYLLFALGGWRWLIAPLCLFAFYPRLAGRPRAEAFHVPVLFAVALPGLAAAAAGAAFPELSLYWPYAATWSAALAIIVFLHKGWANASLPAARGAAAAVAVAVPGAVAAPGFSWLDVFALAASVAAALVLLTVVGRRLRGGPDVAPGAWSSVSAAIALATAAAFAVRFAFSGGLTA